MLYVSKIFKKDKGIQTYTWGLQFLNNNFFFQIPGNRTDIHIRKFGVPLKNQLIALYLETSVLCAVSK